jgi:hypothetical protein
MEHQPSGGPEGCRPGPKGRYATIFLVCEVSKIDEIGLHKFGYVFLDLLLRNSYMPPIFGT